jgi:hypothetical protein
MFETVKHIQSPHQFLTKFSRADEPPISFYTIFDSVWLDLKNVKISLAIQRDWSFRRMPAPGVGKFQEAPSDADLAVLEEMATR